MAISKELNDKLLDIFEGGLDICGMHTAERVIDSMFRFDNCGDTEVFVTLLVRGKTSPSPWNPPLEWDSKEALHLYAERCHSLGMAGDAYGESRARRAVMDLILEDFNNDLEKIRKGLNND